MRSHPTVSNRRSTARTLLVVGVTATLGVSMTSQAGALGSLTWAKLSPAAHPSARHYAAMAYDSTNHELVLFGGFYMATGTFLSDTWTWNGSTWHQESPTNVPPVRDAAAMAYDAKTGHVILYGGFNGTGYRQDMWSWTGSDWTLLSPAHVPEARAWTGMATDPTNSNLILFGGWDGGADLNDTWSWNGTDWTELTPAHSPEARDDFAMVADPAHNRIVVFGGWVVPGPNPRGDTWTWNGTDWTKVSTTGPSARTDMYATFDRRLNRVVLFGGYYFISDTSFVGYNDTWSWSGSSWTKLAPTTKPSRRDSGSMAYFPPSGKTVLFGGFDEYGDTPGLGDTWVLNLAAAAAPPTVSTSTSASKTFTVRWGAPGAPTGYVVEYALRVKNSSGAWVNGPWKAWKNVGGSTTKASFTGTPGTTYLFHAKATYAGGATTGFSTAAKAVVPYDDRWSGASFGSGWSHRSSNGHFLGTETHATTANRTLTVKTAASAFWLVGDLCAGCGKFKVYVDGSLVKTVDSHAASTKVRRVLFSKSFASTKTHTLKIKTLGTSGHPKVVIDAIGVRR
jgi:hypothetical protein